MTQKKDDPAKDDTEEVPPNQSPDTEPEDEEIDLDALIDAKLEERERARKDSVGSSDERGDSGGEEASGTEGDGKGEPTPDAEPAPSPSPVSAVKQTAGDVDAAVAKALAARDHDEEHRKLSEPKEPRKRKGVARALFGD